MISNTNITTLVDKYNIAIVLPSVGNSFYLDYGIKKGYYTFLSEELLDFTRDTFHLSPNREDTFIGGISMGGYGALAESILLTMAHNINKLHSKIQSNRTGKYLFKLKKTA